MGPFIFKNIYTDTEADRDVVHLDYKIPKTTYRNWGLG